MELNKDGPARGLGQCLGGAEAQHCQTFHARFRRLEFGFPFGEELGALLELAFEFLNPGVEMLIYGIRADSPPTAFPPSINQQNRQILHYAPTFGQGFPAALKKKARNSLRGCGRICRV